jgi:hypothetical protein
VPRVFEITPLVSTALHADGTIEHDNRLMYALSDEAVTAFNAILKAYGRYAALFMESLELRSPGFQIWIALRKEYDIADYIIAQRAKIGGADTFKFTDYDNSVHPDDPAFRPRVGCFLFESRQALENTAKVIPFLAPALSVVPDVSTHLQWLIMLDEDPAHVLAEAARS